MRDALHPQLLELREHEAPSEPQIEGEPLDVSWRCFGPLATRDNQITVALDILFLRAGIPDRGHSTATSTTA
ncbi:hypothetical protein ACFQ46_18110 [Kineococcus sp. GCM10028916]|uniref:hypothetical protein n=1 Tax=Kineococcus sp. GCM10028916 TaxID=3273394 RepID=UPI00362ABDA9